MNFINRKYTIDTNYIARQVVYVLLAIPVMVSFWFYEAIFIMKSIYFSIVVAFIIGYYAIIYVISQQKWLNKYSRIITEIDFNEDYIQLHTSKILWKKVKEINVRKEELKFLKKNMYWWAKTRRERTTYVIEIEGAEYYLIAEYFDNIDDIIQQLN